MLINDWCSHMLPVIYKMYLFPEWIRLRKQWQYRHLTNTFNHYFIDITSSKQLWYILLVLFWECRLFNSMRTHTPERDLVGRHFLNIFFNVCVSLVSGRGLPKPLPQQTIIDFFLFSCKSQYCLNLYTSMYTLIEKLRRAIYWISD